MAQRKMRGAIIGFGFISGKGHYPAYLERKDVEIVAVADVCEARLVAAQKSNPKLRAYSSTEKMFEAEKDLDFVDISTPPAFHAAIAIEALKRGMHVLCEKPLTASLSQARDLLLAARDNRRVVFPCHNYKHAPVVKAVNEIIASGEIGKVHSLALQTYRTTHAKGVKEWNTDWRRDKKYSGGGIAMDHGSHTFYLTFGWMKSFPTAVTAKMVKMAEKWDTEDNFTCSVTYPTGQVAAHLTWTAGVRKVMYSIQGSKGAITIDDDDIQVARLVPRTDGKENNTADMTQEVRRFSIASHWGDASHTAWFNSMFDQFIDCIKDGDYVNSELKESYQCIQLIHRAYESSTNGCREMELDTTFAFLKD